jgi:hypothetical protein
VGDLDGDPARDLIIGTPTADGPSNERNGAGEIYVLLGSRLTSGTVRDLAQNPADVTITGAHAGDQVGLSVAVGDPNGDQRNDVIATSPFADWLGENPKPKAGITYVIFRGGL